MTTAATDVGQLWSAYCGASVRARRAARELCALEPALLRASSPPGRSYLSFLCGEVPLAVRRDNVRLLAEETLVWTINTQACVHALASLDRSDVVPLLPDLAETMYRAAASNDENLDSDCSAALHLLWLYGEYRLFDLVVPAVAAKTEWMMGNVGEVFLDQDQFAVPQSARVSERERQEFAQRVLARPPEASGASHRRDVEVIERYRPLWEERAAAGTEIWDLHKRINAVGVHSVLAYAVGGAGPDEQPAVARLITDNYGSGKPWKIAKAIAIVGDEFVPTYLPRLLERAAANCYIGPDIYRDLRAAFEAEHRPDLVDEVSRAEWSAYGRHDDRGLLVELRP